MIDRAPMSLRRITFGDLVALSLDSFSPTAPRIEDEAFPSHEQIRQVAAHLEAAREEERRHIAMEIHDELGQLLTALKMDVSLLGMRPSIDMLGMQKLGEMRELVERAIGAVRNVRAMNAGCPMSVLIFRRSRRDWMARGSSGESSSRISGRTERVRTRSLSE